MKRYRSMLFGLLLLLALATPGTGHATKTAGALSALPHHDGANLAQMTDPEPLETPAPSKKKQGAKGADDDDETDEDSDEDEDNDEDENENDDKS